MGKNILTVFLFFSFFMLPLYSSASLENPFRVAEIKAETVISTLRLNVPERLKRLEFNGLMRISKDSSFSFYDVMGDRNYWIALGGEKAGIEVLSYDTEPTLVKVRIAGCVRIIRMKSNRIDTAIGWKSSVPTKAELPAKELAVVTEDLEIAYALRKNRRLNSQESRRKRVIGRSFAD